MSKFIIAESTRIQKRIDELQRFVDEHAQLHTLLSAIEGPPPVAERVKHVGPGRPPTRKLQVVGILSDGKPRTAAQIRREAGIKGGGGQVYTLMADLLNDGQVAKRADKTYVLPGAAKARDSKGRFLPSK